MDRVRLPDPTFTVGDAPLGCSVELLASYHGPYHLALSTTIADLGLRVDTACLGYPDGPLQVSHLTRVAGAEPALRTFEPDPSAASLKDARGVFLHEHLYEVKGLLEGLLEQPVRVDVPAGAIAYVVLA